MTATNRQPKVFRISGHVDLIPGDVIHTKHARLTVTEYGYDVELIGGEPVTRVTRIARDGTYDSFDGFPDAVGEVLEAERAMFDARLI